MLNFKLIHTKIIYVEVLSLDFSKAIYLFSPLFEIQLVFFLKEDYFLLVKIKKNQAKILTGKIKSQKTKLSECAQI